MAVTVGLIVRISPWEVHIQDPKFVKQLLSTLAKLDKDPWYYRFVGFQESGVSTGPAKLHEIRRRPLLRSLSRTSVFRSLSIVEDKVKELLSKLKEAEGTGCEVKLSNALRCLAFDVACNFCLPQSRSKLQEKDFAPEFNQMMIVGRHVSVWQRHLGFLIPLILQLPQRLMRYLGQEKYLSLIDVHEDIKAQAREVLELNGTSWAPQRHSTLLHSMVNSDLPANQKSVDRMTHEGMTVIGAGVEALANPMAITIFELLKDLEMMKTPKQELNEIDDGS
ncbi:MAG: hypothetical protein Q9218_004141 [Villophora microphyllina]